MAQQMTISVENPALCRALRTLLNAMDGVSIVQQLRTRKKAASKKENPPKENS
ncbi:MAG: hypothetical protein Q4D36_04880 [Bacteroidales bacterium]|nr:hypothetical protein [Bacteroidales bacterium]